MLLPSFSLRRRDPDNVKPFILQEERTRVHHECLRRGGLPMCETKWPRVDRELTSQGGGVCARRGGGYDCPFH
jgi:hypothetical protein